MSISDTIHYFAYGSNLHLTRLQQRTPSCRSIGVALLPSHTLRFHKRGQDGSGKCNAYFTGNPADSLLGVIYALAATEQHHLDEAEGLGRGYNRKSRTLTLAETTYDVFYYVADPAYIDDSLQPFQWYKDLVTAGAQFHQLPLAYQQSLHGIVAVQDFNPQRAALHERILTTLPLP